MAWSLSARVSAAWGLATQTNPSLRATRFYQAMLRSKLSLVLRPDGTLPSLEFLMGALDVPGNPKVLGTLLVACEKALEALEARVRDGKAKAPDRHFAAAVLARSALPAGTDRRHWILAHDPLVLRAFLLSLSDFYSARELDKLGIDKKQAKQLLDPELAQALAASLGEVLDATRLWDLIGGMVSLVQRSEDIQVPGWQKGYLSRMVVPRGDLGDSKAFVVAARLGDVQGKSYQEARTSDDALLPIALEARISALMGELAGLGAATYHTGTHVVAVLPSATAALKVASVITERATPPFGLEFGVLRQPSSVPRGPAVGIGMSYGGFHGGFDGATHRVQGPAIEQAVGLTGIDSPHGALGDPLGVRHVALGAAGLLSKGVVATPAFVEQLEGESSRQGRRFQLPDSGQPVAGVRKPFVAYPISGVREGSDRTVTVLLRLDGDDKASPVEIIRMGIDSFQEFHAHEQGLAPGSCRGLTAGGAGIVPPVAPTTPGMPAQASAPAMGSPMASDPFASNPSEPGPLSGADFEYEDDDDDEEYEFEIEDVPFSPPPTEEEPEDESPFAMDDLEIDDFEEGVLVLEDAPSFEEDEHVLDSVDDGDAFVLDDEDGSSPFAFDSDNAFDSEPVGGGGDDLFSFEDIGGDEEEDPFASAAASNPAAISLSGESSLDAWDTSPPEDEPPDPSEAGEQADDDEALLGFLPPADASVELEEPAADDDPIPLGYLPPAPSEDEQDDAEVREVSLPSRPKRPAPAPSPPPAHPTLMPEDVDAQPPRPKPTAAAAPPSMPASLLALIGDDQPAPSAGPPVAADGSSFQFISADAPPPPEPERAIPEDTPSAELASPEPEEPVDLDIPAAPEPDDEEDDLWAGELDDGGDAFSLEDDPGGPAEPDALLEAFDGDPAQEPEPEDEPEPEPEPDPFEAEPEPDPFEAKAPIEIPEIDDDELPSDPLADGDDDEAFESLFSGDDDDDEFDLADLGYDDEPEPSEPELPVEPLEPEPKPEPEPEDEPEDEPVLSIEDAEPPPTSDEPVEDDDPFADTAGPPPEDEDEDPFASVAGDSLDDDEEDPFDLDEDELDDEPAAASAAGAPRAPHGNTRPRAKTKPPISFMFTGYHIYLTEKNSVLFGHRYGAHLLDVHEYPCGDDIPAAYQRFLMDKIAERFVPRSDLSRPVPKHLEGKPLDTALLQQAFTEIED